MIQRIQTIYLLLAALFANITVWKPEFSGMDEKNIYMQVNDWSSVVVGLVSLIAIFVFAKRKIQLQLCYLDMFAALVSIAGALLSYFIHNEVVSWTPFSGVHILVIVFILLAIRGIRKDEKLIRSLDRLR